MAAANRCISICINDEFIKVCELTKNSRETIVHKTIVLPTPANSFSDGLITNMENMVKVIDKVLQNNDIKVDGVVFTISSTRVATKEVVIPNVRPNKVGEIIRINASDYFPVNIDDYSVRHILLEKIVEDGVTKQEVLVVAAPEDIIMAYYELARQLNLKVKAIDYAGNSSSQLLHQLVNKNLSVVIHVENDSTVVSIFDNNVLQLQRSIPYGKSVLIEEASAKYGTNYDETLKKLQKDFVLHPTFDGDEITSSLMYLTKNIARVVDYYMSRNTEKNVASAYIVGNAVTIRGFVNLFANELKLPLEPITKLYGVVCDKKTYVEESSIPDYLYNIGAMVAPLNFVPKNVTISQERKDTSKFFIMILAAAVVAAIALTAVPAGISMQLKSQKDKLQKEVDNLKPIQKIVSEYNAAMNKSQEADKFAGMTTNNNSYLEEIITELEGKLPSDVTISSMSVSNGSVSLSGTANSKSTVAKLIQQIESIDGVTRVWVPSESESKNDANSVTAAFSLTFSFVDPSTLKK